MNSNAQKLFSRTRRTARVRAKISGSTDRPRLAVNISNTNITAQIIDDTNGKTLAYITTVGKKAEGTMTARAEWVGQEIAKQAKKAKVSSVVMDRHGRKYHGRLKALADSARAEGLEF